MMRTPSKRTFQIVSISLLLLALVWQHIEATRLGYEAERSRRQASLLRGKIGCLRMDMETSIAPAQLALKAKTKLGMLPAGPESLRILGGESPAPAKETLLGRLFPKSWRSLVSALLT